MNTATKRTTTIAASAALLTGAGVAATVPANAAVPTGAHAGVAQTVASPKTKSVSAPVIIYRSAAVSAKASIAAAPKVATTKKKKTKKKYKSRRS
jgi:hypothetical protein